MSQPSLAQKQKPQKQGDSTLLGKLDKLGESILTLAKQGTPTTYLKYATVTVSNTASTQIIAPDPSIIAVTFTNLDGTNPIFSTIGTPATTSVGHYVGPQQSAFLSQALGDNPKIGVNGIAKTAPVSVYVTSTWVVP